MHCALLGNERVCKSLHNAQNEQYESSNTFWLIISSYVLSFGNATNMLDLSMCMFCKIVIYSLKKQKISHLNANKWEVQSALCASSAVILTCRLWFSGFGSCCRDFILLVEAVCSSTVLVSASEVTQDSTQKTKVWIVYCLDGLKLMGFA